jgi:hypothetical protein
MASSNDTKRIQTNNLVPTPQLATASLNFGVGRSPSFYVKSAIRTRTPATQNFCQLLVLCYVYNFVYTIYSGFIHRHSLIH